MRRIKVVNSGLILFLFITACVNNSQLIKSGKTIKKDESGLNKIAVFSLSIQKDGDVYNISIPESKIIETSKVFMAQHPEKYIENDFVCFILDKKKRIVDSILIVQPLNQRYEFPEENGTIGSKIVEQNENAVLLRFLFKKEMKYLRIDKVDKNNRLISIKTIELPVN